MQIIADLQLHSRFSRAVSKEMTIPNIAAWAKRKGIGLIATGDWTHPLWFREIQENLEELGNGLLKLRARSSGLGAENSPIDPLFLLATEVSCIYSQGGKVRRVHTLIWVPTIESAEKINKEMTRQGCNLLSDGRPIIGLTSIQVAELVFSIEPKAFIIPAHCLLPESSILTSEFQQQEIQYINAGDTVLTHTGSFRRVTEVKKRHYNGEVYTIRPWYFRLGLTTTPEHPFYAIKTVKKCPSTGDMCRPSKSHLARCREKACLSYAPSWVQAKDLEIGDVLVYPRTIPTSFINSLSLDKYVVGLKQNNGYILAGGTRGNKLPVSFDLTTELGRFIGYYLAEGSTDGFNSISFCFSKDEVEYTEDVLHLSKKIFGLSHPKIYTRDGRKSIEITFFSKILSQFLTEVCYVNKTRRAFSKKIPDFILTAPLAIQAECLRGWYRGDKGYTSSRVLMNQMKAVCLRLGIIPSILVDTTEKHKARGNHSFAERIIQASFDSYSFSDFSIFTDIYNLKKEIPRSQTKLSRRHGWIDDKFIYIPIRNIEIKKYTGEVFNLEVEDDHSYVAEFAAVHNCWTPWFSVYGALGGFESIEEAFGPYAKQIYAVETGLSSSPSMNWRIKELDDRSIVSFSDAHSGPKLGREATVFKLPNLSYENIYQAIRNTQKTQNIRTSDLAESQKFRLSELSESSEPSIAYTIEFYPEEGKYHYSGHRNCNVRLTPQDSKKKGSICPVCGKPVTPGVMERVEKLAGRSEEELQLSVVSCQLSEHGWSVISQSDSGKQKTGEHITENREPKTDNGAIIHMTLSKTFPDRPPFVMLVPLVEIISESLHAPVASQKVQGLYYKLTDVFGNEFVVLLSTPSSKISTLAGERVAKGIEKTRMGDLHIEPGFDGVFGVVKLWEKEDTLLHASREQLTMF